MGITKQFSMKRGADSSGPLQLLSLYINRSKSFGVELARGKNGTVKVVKSFEFDGYTNQQLLDGIDLSALCKKHNIEAQFCSIVIDSGDDISRVLNIPNSTQMKPQALSNLVAETLGKSDGYWVGFHQLEDDKGELNTVLSCVMQSKIAQNLEASAKKAGMTLCSLELEAGALVNYVLEVNNDDKEVVCYLHIGDSSSHMMMCRGNHKVYYTHHFDYGLDNIISDMCKDKDLPEKVVRDFFRPENDLDFSARLCREINSWIQQICVNLDYLENSSGVTVRQIKCFGPGAESSVLLKRIKQETNRMVSDEHGMTWLKSHVRTKMGSNDTGYLLPLISGARIISKDLEPKYSINFANEVDWVAKSKISPVFIGAVAGLLIIASLGIAIASEYMAADAAQQSLEKTTAEAKRLSQATVKLKEIDNFNNVLTDGVFNPIEENRNKLVKYSDLLQRLYYATPNAISFSSLDFHITENKDEEKFLELNISGSFYGSSQDAPSVVEAFSESLKSEKCFGKRLKSVKIKNISLVAGKSVTPFSINCQFSIPQGE